MSKSLPEAQQIVKDWCERTLKLDAEIREYETTFNVPGPLAQYIGHSLQGSPIMARLLLALIHDATRDHDPDCSVFSDGECNCTYIFRGAVIIQAAEAIEGMKK